MLQPRTIFSVSAVGVFASATATKAVLHCSKVDIQFIPTELSHPPDVILRYVDSNPICFIHVLDAASHTRPEAVVHKLEPQLHVVGFMDVPSVSGQTTMGLAEHLLPSA